MSLGCIFTEISNDRNAFIFSVERAQDSLAPPARIDTENEMFTHRHGVSLHKTRIKNNKIQYSAPITIFGQ